MAYYALVNPSLRVNSPTRGDLTVYYGGIVPDDTVGLQDYVTAGQVGTSVPSTPPFTTPVQPTFVQVFWDGTNFRANGQIIGSGTPGDSTAPAISSFTTSAGDSQVMLAWSGTDNVGITGWTLKRGGTTVYSGMATSYTDTGLTNGTTYTYALTASDAAGNVSAASSATATPAAAASAGYGATPYGTGAYGQ